MNNNELKAFITKETDTVVFQTYHATKAIELKDSNSIELLKSKKVLNDIIEDIAKQNKQDQKLVLVIDKLTKLLSIFANNDDINIMSKVYASSLKDEKECLIRLKQILNNEIKDKDIMLADLFILIDYLNNLRNKRDDYLLGEVQVYLKNFNPFKLNKSINYVYAYDIENNQIKMNKVKGFLKI